MGCLWGGVASGSGLDGLLGGLELKKGVMLRVKSRFFLVDKYHIFP